MIKFFRKIRQSLINENKMGRYFKYAIGEIILVVIGILIALQINNWNQKRLNRKKEISYLEEIKTSLESDTTRISEVPDFNVRKDSIVKNFMRIFDAKLSNEERMEIVDSYSKPFTRYDSFKPKATTWNNFISAENINLITNKDLRTQLMEYYSFNYDGSVQERIKIMNRKVIDENFHQFFTKEYTLKSLNIDTEFPTNTEFKLHLNQQLLSDLFGIRFIMNLQNEFLNDTNERVETLIDLLNKEIQ
ncbi:MAG: DUF6090 family protein [Bacteroidota bacterium]